MAQTRSTTPECSTTLSCDSLKLTRSGCRRSTLHPVALKSGFSLLELIVVVALLSVFAAMVAPNVINQVRENEVAQAAESVREVIAEARSLAIDSGVDYQFRYEPNGQNFVVLPRELEPDDANSTDSDSNTGNYSRLSGELDEGFHLLAAEDEDQTVESLDAAWFRQLPDALRLSQANWF
jgi:prepilin-type N-terminal cleavage/methylation domain-containing protein